MLISCFEFTLGAKVLQDFYLIFFMIIFIFHLTCCAVCGKAAAFVSA